VDLKIQSVQTQNFSSSSSSREEEEQQEQGFRYPGFNSSAATFSFWQVEKQEKWVRL
jgi:hypothetical protein